jgi:hypothetical protein
MHVHASLFSHPIFRRMTLHFVYIFAAQAVLLVIPDEHGTRIHGRQPPGMCGVPVF